MTAYANVLQYFLPSVEDDTALVKNEQLDLGIDFPLRAKTLSPGSTYSALKSVSIENGPLDTKSKTYLELAMLRELLLPRAQNSRRHTLSFCFNPKQFAVFCFHRGLTFCQPGSWLLICHWRNLGHDFYFLLGVWSVCVCPQSFRPEDLFKATATSRVEAV